VDPKNVRFRPTLVSLQYFEAVAGAALLRHDEARCADARPRAINIKGELDAQ
jgi:hypothetical protein